MGKTFTIDDKILGKVLTIHYEDGNDVSGIEKLLSERAIGFDTETAKALGFESDPRAGLDPYRSRLRLLQFATEDCHVYIYDNFRISGAVKSALVNLLERELPVKIAYNSKFDVKMVRHHLGVRRMGKLFDPELAYRLIHCGQMPAKAKLGVVVQELLDIALEKELQMSDWSVPELTEDQLIYGARDAYILIPLRERLIEEITALGLQLAAKLDFGSVDPISSLELTGFPIDPEKWIAVDTQMKEKRMDVMEQISAELRESGAVPQQGLFYGAPLGSGRASTSITSPKQIREMLESYGITLPEKVDRHTRKKSKTTGTPWLKPMRNKFKVIPMLLTFRELDKRKTSYGADYPETHCNPVTGRIHADFDPLGTKTARFACNKPNLQQIPQLPEYRACFVAPDGWKFVGGDFSQIELRIAAELSGDRGYIDAFLSGEDFHAKTAEFMFGVKKGDEKFDLMRYFAKRINFGIIYGMGAGKLALQTDLPESKDELREELMAQLRNSRDGIITRVEMRAIEEQVEKTDTAQDYLDRYYETFQTLMSWLKTQGNNAAKYAQIRMESGRLVKFWVNRKERWSIAQAERNGMNTPIQGLAGEILKIALRSVFDEIYKAGLDESIKLTHCVHDEIQLLVKDEYVEFATELLQRCMIKAGEQFLEQVPVKVDIKSDQMWKK